MPAGAVERDDGVRARRDLGADLGEVQVHRLGVDERQHEGGANPSGRADRTEQIGPVVALIARRARTAALLGPDVGQAALLTDTGFVLPPQLDRLAARPLGDAGGNQFGEVFLCASWASTSCSGCFGRTDTREKFSRAISLPIVRSCS